MDILKPYLVIGKAQTNIKAGMSGWKTSGIALLLRPRLEPENTKKRKNTEKNK